MNFVVMSITLEMSDGLLPIRCEDVLVLASQALVNLVLLAYVSRQLGARVIMTNISPRPSVQLCGGKALRSEL